MSTGWDQGGTPRLICADPSENIVANVFIGESPWRGATPSPTPPAIDLGTTDHSIEFWVKWKFGNSPGDDLFFYSMFLRHSGGFGRSQFGIQWLTGAPNFTVAINGVGSIPNISAGQTGVWGHYCLNMDRSADLEVFINNVSEGTDDISGSAAVDLGSSDFYPLIYEEPLKLATNQGFADGPNTWASNAISPVILGPIAVHNRLMTAAEREASRVSVGVQDFGSSVTLLRYNWDVSGETGWDRDLAHILNAFRVGASTPMAAPTGTEPDVIVVDQSGNGNHYPLAVASSYPATGANVTEVAANKASVALGSDTFFT